LLKRIAAATLRGAAASGVLGLLERVTDRGPDLLRVLTYHRIDDPRADSRLYPGLISATPAAFAAQMESVAARYRVISVHEVLDALRKGTGLPPRSLLLTFDDAYCDFADHAWPVLQRLGLPATLFVPTAFPDCAERTFWWDRLYVAIFGAAAGAELAAPGGPLRLTTAKRRLRAFKQLRDHVKSLPHARAMELVDRVCAALDGPEAEHRVLGWSALRSLASQGLTLAPHTRTHPLLSRIPPECVREEVTGSRRDLQQQIGSCLPILAYPSGGHSDDAVRVLAEEGFELAFTTDRGVSDIRRRDPLRLQRIPVGPRISEPVLRAQLLSWTSRLGRQPGAANGRPFERAQDPA
jgi:peptidoglycan/xylan/chitin deacetylase (PgdA/CDA1 family)